MLKRLRLLLVLSLLSLLTLNLSAQNPPKNWKNGDPVKDSVYGMSSNLALQLLKGKTSTTVVVAVIDGGVYINQPSLAGHIWINSKEIAGNGKDDDNNGYVDDVHGWDFIGGKNGDIKQENLEVTRLYRDLNPKYSNADASKISAADKQQYAEYLKVKKDFEKNQGQSKLQYDKFKKFFDNISKIQAATGKTDLTQADLDKYTPTDSSLIKTKTALSKNFAAGLTLDVIEKQAKAALNFYDGQANYYYNLDFQPRSIVGDNYPDATEKNYGNNDVVGPTDVHGTHVSGIIAGTPWNGNDCDGIADNVKIMVVRVVPDGDERDKDVANGIRYAVDNGAKVINMSFGKPYPYNKKTVDDAVKYAEQHDVLLVHAAGNDGENTDTTDNFPNPIFADNHQRASNWVEVGASDVKGNPATFSNYGKHMVDVFAPGVKIYSSIPDSDYAYFNGTSMASPCVAGVAALIREYFPTLTAPQVKQILVKSVTKIKFKVPRPGADSVQVKYKDLCMSGGIVNAYKAVQLAMKMTGQK